jgi:hypothetical protein
LDLPIGSLPFFLIDVIGESSSSEARQLTRLSEYNPEVQPSLQAPVGNVLAYDD